MQEDVREWEKPGTFACAFVSLIQFQRNATGRPKNACPTVHLLPPRQRFSFTAEMEMCWNAPCLLSAPLEWAL